MIKYLFYSFYFQLIELDINLNINRESLSALRREYSQINQSKKNNKVTTLQGLEYSQFDISNKLLKLGDFFISTSNYIIHKYLLSEKKAISNLIEQVREERYRQVERFLNHHPNIPESSLSELSFIINSAKKDKSKFNLDNNNNNNNKNNKIGQDIKLVPVFKIFEKIENSIDLNSVD
ncbi:hypothetical protein [Cryptosporidium parvum Iowa II]|uniref:Uncharacterized protein n=2 Tax=Cryptosporidium parvum TaxID=5807 RepID=Q5CS29_CRYPI|nr:hypothetical protein [Cryptosporidium parvum Iowa II]EAK88169.1 hypothetical protein cgd5_470 [Cryptosporidium parvum Iowa II]QOY41481.1 Uncharacterized protein CPATCC_0022260 [Cryptosporidium parvum]WKS77701.1 hypothetical protein CPCDC_5g470 [Cryptosporidium sp. 43IA8]WRK32192.1 Uncharacterized protein cpbgf_500470 [Cryptosporidium parvum]|eukprot:QOY41481.1 hypothetical protein CPATCC_002042 [Cryptosporidium parvum]